MLRPGTDRWRWAAQLLCWELKVAACAGRRGKGPEHFAGFILARAGQLCVTARGAVRRANPPGSLPGAAGSAGSWGERNRLGLLW